MTRFDAPRFDAPRPSPRPPVRPLPPAVAGCLAVLLVALAVPIVGCAPHTCCPDGPPFAFACSESYYYYFHGNQLQGSPLAGSMLTQAPWRHLGRVTRGSSAGSGVLIHPNYVLTAAHVAMAGNQFDDAPVSFSLAQPCADCLPYGSAVAQTIWVPEEWIDNVGGSYDSEETRAYDWALLEVDLDPALFNAGVPDPEPMGATNQVYSAFDDLTPRAAGYACGKQADGSSRRHARPYATDDSGAFLGQALFPESGGTGGGALFRTSLEAVSGMSGGPVWIEQGSEAVLVGVMIGSPQEACNDGENWVAGLSVTTRARILGILMNGSAPGMVSHTAQGGAGDSDLCDDLFGGFPGPCPAFGAPGAECGNPEGED